MKVLGSDAVRWVLEEAVGRFVPHPMTLLHDDPDFELLAEQWARGAPVADVANELLVAAMDRALARGRSRAELVLAAGPAGRSALELIDFFMSRGDEAHVGSWAERSRLCAVDAIASIVAALAMLSRIPQRPPSKPTSTPPPPRSTTDPKVLARVRALLAKAESTTFVEEAEALMAKAQELMGRHAIDRAMLAGNDGSRPTSVRIVIDDPYATAKSLLLNAVAQATRCKAVWSKTSRTMTVFGFDDDLASVELLYTSLLLQATSAVTVAGQGGETRTRSRGFRHAFLVAFAHRIGRRLAEVTASTVEDANREHGGSLLPVLVQRDAAIDAAVAEAFPRLGRSRTSASDPAGWAAGTTAANRAALGTDGVGPSSTRRLGPG